MNETDTIFLLQDTVFQENNSFLNSELSQPFEDRPNVLHQLDWFFIISLIFLFLLAFIKLNSRKSLTSFYKELVSSPSPRAYKNDISQTRFTFLPLVICACIVFSLAFYVLFNQLSALENMPILLWTFVMVMFFLLIRFFLLKIVGLLFDMRSIISEWENLTTTLNFISAILCFPFVFIAYYYSSLFILALAFTIFALVFLFRFVRGWTIFRKKMRWYEYFLYLCTIEILPLLMLLKLVTNRLLFF